MSAPGAQPAPARPLRTPDEIASAGLRDGAAHTISPELAGRLGRLIQALTAAPGSEQDPGGAAA